MAMTLRGNYTNHPLTWERTDRGQPLLRVAAVLAVVLLLGFALAYLLPILLAARGPGAAAEAGLYQSSGAFGGEGGMVTFVGLMLLAFIFPTNIVVIPLLAAPFLLAIFAWQRRGQRPPQPAVRRRVVNAGPIGSFMGR